MFIDHYMFRWNTVRSFFQFATKFSKKKRSYASPSCGTTIPEPMNSVNIYYIYYGSLHVLLEQGQFGVVYFGYLEDGTPVAVKTRLESSSHGVNEFLAEALHLIRVHHRNLVNLVSHYKDGHHSTLVYEYKLLICIALSCNKCEHRKRGRAWLHWRLSQGEGRAETCNNEGCNRNQYLNIKSFPIAFQQVHSYFLIGSC
ncbi:hypothetical protein VPH35_085163 [Triticum aestivum]